MLEVMTRTVKPRVSFGVLMWHAVESAVCSLAPYSQSGGEAKPFCAWITETAQHQSVGIYGQIETFGHFV